jgi:hypothetical protein
MQAQEIITSARLDYLDDAIPEYLWPDDRLLRYLSEGQRQACTRGDYIFDDSTPAITRITVANGAVNYKLHPQITRIKCIRVDGKLVHRKTREEMDTYFPTWRDPEGYDGDTVAIVSGRTLRIVPQPANGIIINLDTYRLPKVLTELDQELEIIPEYQQDLIYWVLYEAYNKIDTDTYNPVKAREYVALFNVIFGEQLDSRVRQHQLESEHITLIRPNPFVTKTRTDDWRL